MFLNIYYSINLYLRNEVVLDYYFLLIKNSLKWFVIESFI